MKLLQLLTVFTIFADDFDRDRMPDRDRDRYSDRYIKVFFAVCNLWVC